MTTRYQVTLLLFATCLVTIAFAMKKDEGEFRKIRREHEQSLHDEKMVVSVGETAVWSGGMIGQGEVIKPIEKAFSISFVEVLRGMPVDMIKWKVNGSYYHLVPDPERYESHNLYNIENMNTKEKIMIDRKKIPVYVEFVSPPILKHRTRK